MLAEQLSLAGGKGQGRKLLLDEMRQAGVQLFGAELYHQKFTVLAKTNMPAYLIEYAFHTSKPDVGLLLDNQHRDKLAKATAKAICAWGNVKWIDPVKPTAPSDEHIPSDWAKEAWIWAKDKGITDGTSPQGNITREQAVTMLWRALK